MNGEKTALAVIADAVRERFTEEGLNHHEVAAAAGITDNAVTKLLVGHAESLTWKQAEALAGYAGLRLAAVNADDCDECGQPIEGDVFIRQPSGVALHPECAREPELLADGHGATADPEREDAATPDLHPWDECPDV